MTQPDADPGHGPRRGLFVVVEGLDAKREKRSFTEVETPANDQERKRK